MASIATPTPEKRLQHAKVWLRQARRDQAVVDRILQQFSRRTPQHLPRNTDIAVYLLQQSVEKAAKSLMFAAGEDESTLRNRYGHNSLLAVLDFVNQQLNHDGYGDMLDLLMRNPLYGLPTTQESLQAVEDLTHEVRMGRFRQLAVLPSEPMGAMVQLMLELRHKIITLTNTLLPSRTTLRIDASEVDDASAADYILKVATSAFRAEQLTDDTLTSVREIIDGVAPEWIEQWREAGELDITIIRDGLLSNMVMPHLWALLALYLLSALTFPHEASSRYPGPWNAPDDPLRASESGMLGVQHYNESLGIVTLLPKINTLTRFMLEAMGHRQEYTVVFQEQFSHQQ